MLSPPDSTFIYQRMAPYTLRPLNLSTIHLLGTQINRIADHEKIPWALIGGAAVALHLQMAKHPAAETRSSCDLDVAATTLPNDRRINWICPLLAGGMVGTLGGQRIDWLVRKGADEPLRYMHCRLIASATRTGDGIPVAAADALCALKLSIPPRAFRPKDRWDCRLLLEVGAASIDGIALWIKETVTNKSVREDAQRNISQLTPQSVAA